MINCLDENEASNFSFQELPTKMFRLNYKEKSNMYPLFININLVII